MRVSTTRAFLEYRAEVAFIARGTGTIAKRRNCENKADTEVLREVERLREENSQLMEDMPVYTGLPGQVHRQHARMEQLKSLY